jgi:hypothetical protein
VAILRLALATLCIAGSACVSQAPKTTAAPTARVTTTQVRDVAERVRAIWQIPREQGIDIEPAVKLGAGASVPASPSALPRLLKLRPRNVSMSSQRAVADYDRDHAILRFLPALPKAEDALQTRREAIAHHVRHAFQGRVPPQRPPKWDDDREVARVASMEGDAALTAALFAASEAGVHPARVARRLQTGTVASNPHRWRGGHPLLSGTRLGADAYEAGVRFVAEIYRLGGLEAVARLADDPPQTSEQVLHVEKFCAGEQSVPVEAPAAPPNHTLTTSNRLGEVALGSLLAECIGAEDAREAATGWGGDHYSVVTNAEGTAGLLLVVAWDDEASASRFATLAPKLEACWSQPDRPAVIARENRMVSVLVGLDSADEEQARSLLEGTVDAPSPRPRERPPWRPQLAMAKRSKASIAANAYGSPWLGISGRLPEGFAPTVVDEVGVQINSPGEGFGSVVLSEQIHMEEFVALALESALVTASTQADVATLELRPTPARPADTSLGPGITKVWTGTGGLEIHITAVPICNGGGSLVLSTVFGDQSTKSVLDKWLGSLNWTESSPPPACTFLEPS